MNDRLKRRKKGGERASKEQSGAKGPEPLQPKYFEADLGEQPAAAPSDAQPVQPPPVSRPRPETQADFQLVTRPHRPAAVPPAAAPSVAPPPEDAPGRPARRRRKRGGRGGARRVPGAPAPVVAPVDAAEPEAAAAPLTPEGSSPEAPVAEPAVAPAPAPVPTPPVPAATSARPSKGTVVLAIGLPGSGKSSWFKRHSIHPLSSDLLRELLFDDAQEQRFQDLVFSNLRSMLKARLIARRPMSYVDATNLTPHDRHSWIKLAKDYGYEVQGLFFDVPLEVCLERHQRRGRVVPEDIMRKMAGKLKPPTFEEGFSKITVVRVKQKENVAENVVESG